MTTKYQPLDTETPPPPLAPPPYTGNHNCLCSPYGDTDASSALSPASIESLDIMEEAAWLREQRREWLRFRASRGKLSLTWKSNKCEIIYLVVFSVFFVTMLGFFVAGWVEMIRSRRNPRNRLLV